MPSPMYICPVDVFTQIDLADRPIRLQTALPRPFQVFTASVSAVSSLTSAHELGSRPRLPARLATVG
jgi:hypothetical protein